MTIDVRPPLEAVRQQLLAQYHLVDHRRADESLVYCAPDFTLEAMGMSFGREQYEQFMEARKSAAYQTRHIIENLRIIDESQNSITVEYVTSVHRLDDGEELPTTSVADCRDRWILGEHGWRVAERNIDLVFDARPADKRGL